MTFLGIRSDVPELLPDFDIAAQTSRTEGVTRTAVGARLSHIRMIAANILSQPEPILECHTGWLGPSKDPPG